ncbi:hypothetical protein ABZ912_49035 [Nonomuraea angiospora]|uniref:hypothetical protein n=1 Tax=Nonomuraea angiospora TaxID=46172 RepID=UPI0033EADB01
MAYRYAVQMVKRAGAALAMVPMLAAALTQGPATAATMGPISPTGLDSYQLRTCVAAGHYDIKAFTINGLNQNNNYVASPKLELAGNRAEERCKSLSDWWWKGVVDVDFWDDNDNKLGTRQCYVAPGGDPSVMWWRCTFA